MYTTCLYAGYFEPLFQMAGMMGMQDMNADDMSGKLDDMMNTIRQVNEQFKNAVRIFAHCSKLFINNTTG